MRESITQSIAGGVGWTALAASALEHRLVPALFATFKQLNTAFVPQDLFEAFQTFCDANRERNEHLLAALETILHRLDVEGIQAIAFKGPTLAQDLYGDLSQKCSGDLDFLIRRSDVSRVCEILECLGYYRWRRPGARPMTEPQHRMYRRYQCEYRFVRTADAVVVEPHWALSQRMFALDLDYDGLFERARRVSIHQKAMWAFSPEDHLLTLCIHGAKHGWKRLAWIRDIAAFLNRHPRLDFDTADARARSQGCRRVLILGLGVASRYAGAELPTHVRSAVERDAVASQLIARVGQRFFDGSEREVPSTQLSSFRFRMRERRRDRVRYVLRTLFVPGFDHIALVKLPSFLVWLYYPLRCVHDYLALPVWLAGKRVSRAVRDARAVTGAAAR